MIDNFKNLLRFIGLISLFYSINTIKVNKSILRISFIFYCHSIFPIALVPKLFKILNSNCFVFKLPAAFLKDHPF